MDGRSTGLAAAMRAKLAAARDYLLVAPKVVRVAADAPVTVEPDGATRSRASRWTRQALRAGPAARHRRAGRPAGADARVALSRAGRPGPAGSSFPAPG